LFHHFRVYLMSQNRGDLVKLLLHQAVWDSESRARLVLMRQEWKSLTAVVGKPQLEMRTVSRYAGKDVPEPDPLKEG
jgi:hypothetical protein